MKAEPILRPGMDAQPGALRREPGPCFTMLSEIAEITVFSSAHRGSHGNPV
jgi:hypothetical protein